MTTTDQIPNDWFTKDPTMEESPIPTGEVVDRVCHAAGATPTPSPPPPQRPAQSAAPAVTVAGDAEAANQARRRDLDAKRKATTAAKKAAKEAKKAAKKAARREAVAARLEQLDRPLPVHRTWLILGGVTVGLGFAAVGVWRITDRPATPTIIVNAAQQTASSTPPSASAASKEQANSLAQAGFPLTPTGAALISGPGTDASGQELPYVVATLASGLQIHLSPQAVDAVRFQLMNSDPEIKPCKAAITKSDPTRPPQVVPVGTAGAVALFECPLPATAKTGS